MYALKPPPPQRNPRPVEPPRKKARVRSRKKVDPYRTVAYETAAKLTVNIILSVSSIVALVQLLPYQAAQDVKLQELQAAVKLTGDRVQRVQTKFGSYFDPNQARENMQELTDRIDPSRRQVVWEAPGKHPPAKAVDPQPAPDDEN